MNSVRHAAASSRAAWIPQDRRASLATGSEIVARAWGVVLFADITGFTPLTERLVAQQGRRSGADALVRLLNQVYPPLIEAVEHWGGSVIGFSGDALTCWFAPPAESQPEKDRVYRSPQAQTACRALSAAVQMQRTMGDLAGHMSQILGVTNLREDSLAIRITVTSGDVARILVGDPAISVLDALAGPPLHRIALGDHLARRGEIILDAQTWQVLEPDERASAALHWLASEPVERFAVWDWQSASDGASLTEAEIQSGAGAAPGMQPLSDHTLAVPENEIIPWILPSLRGNLGKSDEEFLAELRPAVALFVRFGGIDFADDAAPGQLQCYVRWAQSVIHRDAGALIQVTTGDKGAYLYAVFGAPVAHDDDVERALLAALALINPPDTCAFITDTQIGISQGLMRVGMYGGPTRRTYGAQGDSVNTGARLMSAAASGEILVTESVAEAVRERSSALALPFSLTWAGALPLKGKNVTVPCYRVTRQAVTDESLHPRFATALVGREAELNAITSALDAVDADKSHRGRLIILEGPAGIGKSHLLHEAVYAARAAGWEIQYAVNHSTTQSTPFTAARQFVTALLQLAHAPQQDGSVQDAIARILPHAVDRAPLLNDLLGATLPESTFTRALDVRTRQDALIALLIELIQARAATARLLFVLEDAHWLDEGSALILQALLAMLEYAPVVTITTVRPNLLPDALRAPDDLTLRLPIGDLSGDSITALVRTRLGSATSPLATALILMQSQGNPFFAEEFTDALVEAGSLVLSAVKHAPPVNGATAADESATAYVWDLAPATVRALRNANCLAGEDDEVTLRADAPVMEANLGVPNSIHGILLARLDRLPDTARLALKIASVVGRTFTLSLLQHVRPLQAHRHELDASLRLALLRDFVRVDAQDSEASGRYYFRHNLIRDVAYNTLLDAQQRDLHEQVARALEEVQPDATEELASHYYRSDTTRPDVRARAFSYLVAAARHAQSEYANETALTFYQRALELQEDPQAICHAIEVLHILGRREDEAHLLERLHARQQSERDDLSLAWETARLWADYQEALGDYPAAQVWLQKALAIAQSQQWERRQARVRVRLGTIAWRQGEFDEAQAELQRALAQTDEVTSAAERGDALYALGLVSRQQARYEEAQRCFAQDLALRETAPNPEREARTLNALGNMRAVLRDPVGALAYFQRALHIRRTIGDRAGVGASLLAIGQCYSSMARLAEAEEMLRDALRIQRAIHNRFQECLVGNELGIVQWLCGQYARAEETLSASLAIARALDSAMLESYVLCNLGQVQRDAALAAADGDQAAVGLDTAHAIETLERGLAMALEQEDPQLAAIYQGDLAHALHLAGDQQRALALVAAAESTYVTMEQEKELTTVLPTRARILLAMGDMQGAVETANRVIALLDEASDDPPEFAHRDYYYSAVVLHACAEDATAEAAFANARRLLLQRADLITRPDLRASFLTHVPHNRAILAVAD